ncbi:hypothetical protein HDF26_004489 [Pedobacter cryoconitis]|uniref:Bulb-type lectin domain-containing protein n=1 Tax=Pedobacter cryoconitis TaxID=188932 RepID=A0A7W8ZNH9_9SPHI|nr:hypothetical protein [Pedobacter cryoconitis]MBB5637256.1 hypothetical protein [Pedobacter cryoconitis]MBB6274016.1 hypothetical protein [Pedobacter cryoconitis]
MKNNFIAKSCRPLLLAGLILSITGCAKNTVKSELKNESKISNSVLNSSEYQFSIAPEFKLDGKVFLYQDQYTYIDFDFNIPKGVDEDPNTITEIRIFATAAVHPQTFSPIERSNKDWPVGETSWKGTASFQFSDVSAFLDGVKIYFAVMKKVGTKFTTVYSSDTFELVLVTKNTFANPFPVNDQRYVKNPMRFIGENIVARNGIYQLRYQGDGNLVLYKNGTEALWASGTANGPGKVEFTTSSGMIFINSPIASNNHWINRKGLQGGNPFPDSYWALQDDGNLVCYPSYRTAPDGTITPYGTALCATATAGRKSPHFGEMR